MATTEYENTIRNIKFRKGKDNYDKGYSRIEWSDSKKEKEEECTSSKENTESLETTKENA